jgi:hypothetical protein
VVCFDKSPTQLIGEYCQPIKAKPGQLERYDCETSVMAQPICSSSSTCIGPGAKSKSPIAVPPSTSLPAWELLRSLSQSGAHPRRAGQSVNPHGRRTLSSLPVCRSPPAEPPGVPLRPQARQLVEDGRNRDWRSAVNAWIGASTARSALYPKLPPGSGRNTSRIRIIMDVPNREST